MGTKCSVYREHKDLVQSTAFSHDGKYLVVIAINSKSFSIIFLGRSEDLGGNEGRPPPNV